MPTIDQLIQRCETDKARAEQALAATMVQAKTIVDRSVAQGRDYLTRNEENDFNALAAKRLEQKRVLDTLNDQLTSLRDAQADEENLAGVYARGTRTDAQPTRRAYEGGSDGRIGGAGAEDRNVGTGPQWVRRNDAKPAVVRRGQRFVDHEIVSEYAARRATAEQHIVGHHGSLGQMIRAMSTTTGSALVPTVWAGSIIDRARNASRVFQAGATLVPMDAKQVQIGRLAADPTAAFRAEGSLITATDPTFDNVTLDSKTMSALVVGSMEWFQDADNVDEVVSNAIAQAMATELDKQALFGGVTTGGEAAVAGYNNPTPPKPRGVLATLLAQAPSSVLGSGANGTPITSTTPWNEILDAIYTPRQFNEEPTAILWNAKMAQKLAKSYDTTGQPLSMPADVSQFPRLITNQIPSFTQGTATGTATDVFVGDWSQLLIGQRLDVTIQILTERYAEFGQVGIVAHWRGDVALARPRAFSVYRYLIGA
ncbi:phage major capsid protein [Micromonospora fulviviridis]|uniref:Phage major capsid protein n=1 Tax=Micromonospora fulviviridis TaxID=47860 RepID=A0ABV2VDM7_9ACTN